MDAAFASENPAFPGAAMASADQAGKPTPAMALAMQIGEIAHSRMISRAKKEKRIATAVRVAVVGATAYKSPAETLNIASELAAVAAGAAPQFKDVITDAVSFIPAVARIDGAAGQIRTAVYYAAAKAGSTGKTPTVVAAGNETSGSAAMTALPASSENGTKTSLAEIVAEPGPPLSSANVETATAEKAASSAGPENGTGAGTAATGSDKSNSWAIPEISLGDNASLHLTADVSGRYDDNIFLTKNDKVSDEIVSLTPGAEFQFGQNSLSHGSLAYQENFERYLHTSAANAQLATSHGDFGYDNGSLTVGTSASFQQLNQNNRDVVVAGKKAIIRQDVLSLDGSVESHFTAKTSVRVGGDYNDINFRTAGLVDNSSISLPLKLYYAVTPKVDLSTGVTYRDNKVKGAARDTRDMYYNIGARGTFTPKLSGEISMGYKTRSFGHSSNDSTFGFDGSLTYEITPKTSGVLVLSRDFSTGAQGETLKNTRFSFTASSSLSAQWQANATLSYQNAEYSTFRKDDYWEGGLSGTYIYNSHLSASAGYTLRNNSSTLSGAEFSDNIFNLVLSFRS